MSSKHDEPKDVIASRSARTARATTRSKPLGLSSSYRLKSKKDFAAVQNFVQRHGQRLYSKHFLLLVAQATGDRSRLGITVTTKIDKRAVVRNRLKRCIREVFRLHRSQFTSKIDIVVIARNESPSLTFQQIEREILGALRYGKLYREGDR